MRLSPFAVKSCSFAVPSAQPAALGASFFQDKLPISTMAPPISACCSGACEEKTPNCLRSHESDLKLRRFILPVAVKPASTIWCLVKDYQQKREAIKQGPPFAKRAALLTASKQIMLSDFSNHHCQKMTEQSFRFSCELQLTMCLSDMRLTRNFPPGTANASS